MSDIIQAVEKIINWRKTYYPRDTSLISPLTLEQIQDVIEGFPFYFPSELLELYQYSSTGVNIDASLIKFCSLEEALDLCLRTRINYSIAKPIFKEIGIPYLRYFKGCFQDEKYKKILANYPSDRCDMPIITGYCKEIYHVICSQKKTNHSPVWLTFPGLESFEYARSLTSLMLTFAECYETGAFYTIFTEYGEREIEEDLDKVELIFEKYNPDQIDNWRKIWRN